MPHAVQTQTSRVHDFPACKSLLIAHKVCIPARVLHTEMKGPRDCFQVSSVSRRQPRGRPVLAAGSVAAFVTRTGGVHTGRIDHGEDGWGPAKLIPVLSTPPRGGRGHSTCRVCSTEWRALGELGDPDISGRFITLGAGDGEEAVHGRDRAWGDRKYLGNLYLPLNFALKLLKKLKSALKKSDDLKKCKAISFLPVSRKSQGSGSVRLTPEPSLPG